MKKLWGILILFLFISLQIPTSLNAQSSERVNGEWLINPEDSEISFKIQALLIFPVEGAFEIDSGSIIIQNDLLSVDVNLVIDAASVDTGNKKRDEHLEEEEFFHAEKYPHINFSSNKITKQTEESYSVEGDLTIKGVTKPIVVPVKYKGINEKGQIVFSATKTINRREYNIYYTGRGVSDTAEVFFEVVADKIN